MDGNVIDTFLSILAIIFGITLLIIDYYVYVNYKDLQETYDRPRGFYTLVVVGNGFGKTIPKIIKRIYFICLVLVFATILLRFFV